MRNCLILIALFCQCQLVFCQTIATEDDFNENFAWSVKHIDQFINRFNNDDDDLKEYIKNNSPKLLLSRKDLVKSLFDFNNKKWDLPDVKAFLKQVTDTTTEQYIGYYDMNWYAKIDCAVTWNNQPKNVTLTLKIVMMPDSASKWVISGVNAAFLTSKKKKDSLNSVHYNIPQPAKDLAFLHPYSHATSFSNIDLVSGNKTAIAGFFLNPGGPCNDETNVFINEILNNHLTLKNTLSVQYYFFDIKGWVIEVSQFNRYSKNSGWLISKLIKT